MLAGSLIAGSGVGCASQELYLQRHEDGNKNVFVAGVNGFMDGFLDNELRKLGHDIHRECNATVVVNSVDYEGRNLKRIREAHKKGERIALVGYSMGSGRVYSLAKQCSREGIKIDLMVLYDPTFTETTPMYKPNNVDRCVAYFSLGPFEGNKKNLFGQIEIRNSRKDHFGLVNWNDLKNDWTSDIKKIRQKN